MLKGRILTLLLMAFSAAAFLGPAQAAIQLGIYGHVNKVQYEYGESGKLHLWIVNEGTESLILEHIIVIYPWNNILPWEGNHTIEDISDAISVDGNRSYTFDFTVPADIGPLPWGSISVTVITNEGTFYKPMSMNVLWPPSPVEGMDNLVTLFTVQIIVAIIAAIIIAAAVFLSGRGAGTAWQKAE
jgi:hypothetical protein